MADIEIKKLLHIWSASSSDGNLTLRCASLPSRCKVYYRLMEDWSTEHLGWQMLESDTVINTSDIVELWGINETLSTEDELFQLSATTENGEYGNIFISGHLTALLDYDCPSAVTSPYCFKNFFEHFSGALMPIERTSGDIVLGENFTLPTELSEYCMKDAFKGCNIYGGNSGFNFAPTLVSKGSCEGMFENALFSNPNVGGHNFNFSLATPAEDCYKNMFKGANTSYTVNIASLPSTNLAKGCYESMFENAYGITLSRIRMDDTAENCCKNMFKAYGIAGPRIDPYNIELTSTNIAKGCYEGMFEGTELAYSASSSDYEIQMTLPATTIAEDSYKNMFKDVSFKRVYDGNYYGGKLRVTLSASTVPNGAYQSMFENFTGKVDGITREITGRLTVVMNPTSIGNYGCNAMFKNCPILYTTPSVSAVTVADYGCQDMFNNCTNITKANVPPAQTIGRNCYERMYNGCTNIATISGDTLPAMTIKKFCYKNMFTNCTKLTQTPSLPAPILTEQCYKEMFKNCSAITEVTVCNRYPCVNNFHSKQDWLPSGDNTGVIRKYINVPLRANLKNAYTQCVPDYWTIRYLEEE